MLDRPMAKLLAWCAVMALPGASLHAETMRGVAEHVATFNALPDTHVPLELADQEDDGIICRVPLWAQSLTLSSDEAGALVALVGAYCPQDGAGPMSMGVPMGRRFTLPEQVAGALLDAKVADIYDRAFDTRMPPFRPDPPVVDLPPRPRKVVPVRADVRFVRLLSALDSCPAAFAALGLAMEQANPRSPLTALAREARTISVDMAVPPRSHCDG
jgi:hypothetical protein